MPQNSRDANSNPDRQNFFDLPAPTFGGKQLWTDHLHRAHWRIQKNELTGHFRLLDPANIRRTWGTMEQCLTALEQRVGASEQTGVVVVLLHGLMRSRNSMRGMTRFLNERGGFAVVNFEYASTRNTLQSHAEALHNVLNGFPSAEGFHFVGHSLGNLVVRRLIHLIQDLPSDTMLGRFQRMVMLGAPNNGARFAQRFKNNVLFQTVWGKSGDQLGVGWEQLESQLATPPFEFGVVAGVGPLA
ncbi:MAG: lipase, partial [Planctomycetota bacterium]